MNLFELFVKIGIDDQASDKISSLSSKLGTGLKTAAKIGTAAVGAASGAIAGLSKAAIDGYADYEQLVGGVETLFGAGGKSLEEYASSVGKSVEEARAEYDKLMQSQQAVLDNADISFRTAGLSANEYMETVTSFSASLLSSLGGDTEKAAEYADQAIIDMADNANKMGTSMEMIQNAYQGFAKQNYTMLDNLKLGYGGTKEEMARLIEDAAKLKGLYGAEAAAYANMGVNGDLSIIIDAIHTVQTELGITGTTAIEASSTISGSIASMKSAWTNLVTGIADENANIDELIGNFVDGVITVGENMIPRVEQILSGIGTAITKIAPIISETVPGIVTNVLPSMLDAGVQLIDGLLQGLIAAIPSLAESAVSIINTLTTAIFENLPSLMEAAIEVIITISNGISESLPELIPTIVDVVLQIVETLTNPDQLKELLNAALTLVKELAKGIVDAIPNLVESAVQLVKNFVNFILDKDNIKSIIDTAFEIIMTVSEGLISSIPQLVSAAIEIITELCSFFLDPENISALMDMALEIVVAIAEGLVNAATELISGVATLIGDIVDTFADTDWGQIGKNIVDGLLNGLKNTWTTLTSWFTNAWDSLVGGVKDFLGIHSPSRVFAGIGKNMALGLGEGWEDEYGDIKRGIQNDFNFKTGTVDFASSGFGVSSAGIINSTASNRYSNSNFPSSIELRLSSSDGQMFGRWLVPFVRSENRSNPEVVSDI